METKVELTDKMKNVMESIEKMTVMELADLVKVLEEKFGVSAAAPAAAAAAPAAATASPVEEKSTFTVVLTSAGATKIQVIKELRTLTSLGLKEAKDLVDGAPKTIKENATKEEADKMKKALEAQGAKIELK
ncbi:MAG: 50S ribosomal protein L7/L12 [Candidatus Omnitrophica bacterium]|nr:50S ribosomal protein L7/L12 [Candidatus Omnitrophota bacterium]